MNTRVRAGLNIAAPDIEIKIVDNHSIYYCELLLKDAENLVMQLRKAIKQQRKYLDEFTLELQRDYVGINNDISNI